MLTLYFSKVLRSIRQILARAESVTAAVRVLIAIHEKAF